LLGKSVSGSGEQHNVEGLEQPLTAYLE